MRKRFKEIKKVFAVLLALSMLISVLPVAAVNSVVKITPATRDIVSGSSGSVSVNVELSASGVALISWHIKYDSDIFNITNDDVVLDPEWQEKLSLERNVADGQINIIGGSVSESPEIDEHTEFTNSRVATIRITAKSTAPNGEYGLKFSTSGSFISRLMGIDSSGEVKIGKILPADFQDGKIRIVSQSGPAGGNPTRPTPSPSPSPSTSPSPSPSPSTSPSPSPTPTDEPKGKEDFDDLEGYDWAADSIDRLIKAGAISGTGGSKYEPDRNITRAEFAKLIVSIFNLQADSNAPSYSDVGEDDWFRPFIAAAAQAGIVTGYPEGDFKPDASISREEMAAVLVRAFKAVGIEVPDGTSSFEDAAEIGDWALGFVSSLVEMGIVNGRGENMFVPKDNLTRAEAAKVLSAALDILEARIAEQEEADDDETAAEEDAQTTEDEEEE